MTTTSENKKPAAAAPTLIVGVGASAGGLAAFRELLSSTPPDSGLAYVLLPHLDPRHKSVMQELLANKTAVVVCQAEDKQKVEPNTAYLLPAGHGLNIVDGKLRLVQLESPQHQWTAVDQFLRSLAEDARERAVAIILSGTGSHGTLGIKAIKQAGGLVMAQAPEMADYPQMPDNAISSGMVDLVMAAADMPAAMIEFASHAYLVQQPPEEGLAPEQINPILNILRTRTRFDFRHYRKNMLIRRIHRRMSLCHIDSLHDYQQYLRDKPDEIAALNQDLLIGVTAFFRDPEAFHVLDQRVIYELVNLASEDRPVRVWVPGCSTGEEAYSIAILLMEAFNAVNKAPAIQVFATDIDESALVTARQGTYPASIMSDVTPKRLQQFMIKVGEDKYRVNQRLRDCVIFATQSLISDAPFSQLDLISCRNLMIYLLPEVQAKLIQLFHFSLKENGYLLLGPSESIGRQIELFGVVSKKWKLFKRVSSVKTKLLDIPIGGVSFQKSMEGVGFPEIKSPRSKTSMGDLAIKTLVAAYAPATVLINRHYQILQFIGPTNQYLELPSGEPTHDLMLMLRQGLSSRVRAIAHRAWQEQQLVIDNKAKVTRDGHHVYCTLTARPISNSIEANQLMLISFTDRAESTELPQTEENITASMAEQTIVEQLEYELKATKEDLQSNVEELESSNEELKAANEEMMSMNEELQSANEELETSKEELQSMNEELNTVNVELQTKVEELETSHDDVSNLLASTDIATIFLDRSMNIKLFNPATAELLRLRSSDKDRPIKDFSSRLTNDHFIEDAKQVLAKLVIQERTVTSNHQQPRHYLRRMVPYRASHDRIGGVVVTFVDITGRYVQEKQLEQRVVERTQELQNNKQQLSLVLEAARAAVWEMNEDKHRVMLQEEIHSTLIADLPSNIDDSWQVWLQRIHPAERGGFEQSLNQALAGDVDHWEYEYRFSTAKENYHWISDFAHIARDEQGKFQHITGAVIDIDQRKMVELALLEREQRLSAIMNSSVDGFILLNNQGIIIEYNFAAGKIFGFDSTELLGRSVQHVLPKKLQHKLNQFDFSSLDQNSPLLNQRIEMSGLSKDQQVIPLELTITSIQDFGLYVSLVHDLSERRLLEQEVSNISNWEKERTGRELHDGLGQRLTGLGMLTANLKKRYSSDMPIDAAMFDDITQQLKEAIHEVSRISQGLAPISITAEGLSDALASLVEQAGPHDDRQCHFMSTSAIVINDKSVAHELYRIAQEAFNNAVKYANASQISLTLADIDGVIELCVRDNGCGFDVQQKITQKSFGIRIMHYRANSIGATLNIESRPGKGTQICCFYQYQGIPDIDAEEEGL